MVIMTPKIKLIRMGQMTFWDLLISMPMPSPMGVMARSAPRVKTPIPKIRRRAPNKKSTSVPAATGATVMLKTSTMAVMGRTDASDSKVFSLSCFLKLNAFSVEIPYCREKHPGNTVM